MASSVITSRKVQKLSLGKKRVPVLRKPENIKENFHSLSGIFKKLDNVPLKPHTNGVSPDENCKKSTATIEKCPICGMPFNNTTIKHSQHHINKCMDKENHNNMKKRALSQSILESVEIIEVNNSLDDLLCEKARIEHRIKSLQTRLEEINEELKHGETQSQSQTKGALDEVFISSPISFQEKESSQDMSPALSVELGGGRSLWQIGTTSFDLVDSEGKVVENNLGYKDISPHHFQSLTMPPAPHRLSERLLHLNSTTGDGELTQLINEMA